MTMTVLYVARGAEVDPVRCWAAQEHGVDRLLLEMTGGVWWLRR